MVNVHNSEARTLQNKDPVLQRHVQHVVWQLFNPFCPCCRGGGQFSVATSMQGPTSHKTRLKTAL